MSNPQYPVYIISKGRAESRTTSGYLERLHIPYHIVVEPQEYDEYVAAIDPSKIFVLPFSNLGQGSIPARNWVWEHAISIGAKRHWLMDDNMQLLWRVHQNRLHIIADGLGLRIMEEFTDRYKNVVLSGPNDKAFSHQDAKRVPIQINTRIYSCTLILNSANYRWRGCYNEDTDLCLRVLKDGWCTILFNAFVMNKGQTMKMKGGNTDELYIQNDEFDGRLEMAKSLKEQHPDVVKIRRRWGRWQHVVNYKPFRGNKLIRKPGLVIPDGVNNYGMRLVDMSKSKDSKA